MGSREGIKKFKVFLSRLLLLSIMQFIFRGVGEYLDEFVAEFHTSLPLASWALTLTGGLSMLFAPIILRVYRVFSYRHVTVAAGLAFGLLFIVFGWMGRNTTHVFIWSVLSGISLGAVGLSTYLELGEKFISNFGMINTAISVISGPLTVGYPLLVEYFKVEYGVRWTIILTGAISWHLVIAGVCLTTNSIASPSKKDSLQPKEAARSVSFLRNHPSFVCHFMFQALALLRTIGVPLFLYPFEISKGLQSTQAAILISVSSFGSVIGRLGALGIFLGKVMKLPLAISVAVIAAPMLMAMVVQILSIYFNNEVCLILMALTTGMSVAFEISWGISSVMDLSCEEHFKEAASWLTFFGGMGSTFGGLIIGLTHHIRGSYDDVMILMIALSGMQSTFVIITLTWKRLVKKCPLQTYSSFRNLEDVAKET